MRFPRVFAALLGLSLCLGCGSGSGTGMKNLVPGTGPDRQMNLKSKDGKVVKEMPPEPPLPEPPPLNKKG